MSAIKFHLKAENSSGQQRLIIDPDHEDLPDDEVAITLVGQYEGKYIQIDFNEVDRDTFKEHLQMLVNQL